MGGVVEAVGLDGRAHPRLQLGELADDPAVDPAGIGRRIEIRLPGGLVQLAEPGGVPDFGGEIAIAGDPALGQLDIPPLDGERRQGEAQGIGAVLVHQIDRIDDIALRLGIFLPPAVAHQTVNIDIGKGHPAVAVAIAHEIHAHHHHPGDPEEDDVLARHQYAAGIVAVELRRLVGPAQGRERPQGGREPGIQHIGIAGEARRLAIMGIGRRLGCRFCLLDKRLPVRPVPDRQLMAPPELARNAPGLDIAHPLEIDPGERFGHEAGAAVLHRLDTGPGQGLRVGEPLVGQPGFERHAGAVAMGHAVPVLVDPLDQALRFEVGDDLPAGGEPVEAAIGFGRIAGDAGIGIENIDHRQIVAPADLEIVEIVRRGDLDRTAALLRVGVFVGDDGQAPADQRQHGVPADQIAIARVLRVHGDARIAQHGLRPGRRDDDMPALLPLDGVAQVPQMAVGLALFDLKVGNRGVKFRVPVDQPLVAIDQPVLVEPDEHAQHGARQALVHGEAFALPVAGRAQPGAAASESCRPTVRAMPRPARRMPRARWWRRHRRPAPCRGRARCPLRPASARPPSGSPMPAWSVPGCHRTLRPCMR